MTVFDLTGKEIVTFVDEVKTAGYYNVEFNASNLSSGIYFYRISAGNYTATKKMMLIR
ncbi:MAG: T9SS type A sorting domain-containing protein [Ignavibacteria bacterium]|nr:T9SS type A sorting domain-containing protein [Ignavibacteria bacterium]